MAKSPTTQIKSGASDKLEGTVKNLVGKVKSGLGRTLGNPKLKARGDAEQNEGRVQKKVGQIKQVFDL
jgi:uncharacterized protein YjbJ (UPF0337 family)